MASLRKCKHPRESMIVDPEDERRGLCGVCGGAWVSPELYQEALAEARAAAPPNPLGSWGDRWLQNG